MHVYAAINVNHLTLVSTFQFSFTCIDLIHAGKATSLSQTSI